MRNKNALSGSNTKRLAAKVAVIVCGLIVLLVWLKTKSPSPRSGAVTADVSSRGTLAAANGSPANAVAVSTNLAVTGRTGNIPSGTGGATNPYAATQDEPASKRAWDYNFLTSLSNMAPGDAIQFELTGGEQASGVIRHVEQADGQVIVVSGEVSAPEPGQFSFRKQTLPGKAGDYSGEVIFPRTQRAFRIEPSGSGGRSELVARRLSEVMCLALPAKESAQGADEPVEIPPLNPSEVAGSVPAHNDGIISLQSLPGARCVIYLDYRGGYTPTWGGITYAKPNASNAQIKDVWKRVAEDYASFNINVTTDVRVYEAAPENSRQRCVLTPTTTAAPGAGGVAFIGDWNTTGDRPCWAFYSTGKAAAEVVAHEVGHTLGLGHDGQQIGTNTVGYFDGHGSGDTGWAPIMGAGYYDQVTQWSKGEYTDANNFQDDLNIIISNNNNVTNRADDSGAVLATARYLEIYSNSVVSAEGVVETTGDTDAYQFTTTGGAVSLNANVAGDWSDLAIMATLADATDTIIASNNPQNILSASISTNLTAGTYTFRVTGTGRNNPLTDGFTAYASLGYYSITGSVAGANIPSRLSIAERSTNGTVVGTVTSATLGVNPLTYTITSGNSSNAFALDNNGVLTVANSSALIYANLAYGTQMTVQYELFVSIFDTVTLQTETNRRVVVQVLDMPEPATQMIHRWSFANGTDSINGANATLVGSASYSGGKLVIPGGAARANCATVNLTNTLSTNISLTIEGWFTMATLQNWSKVWMFGRPNGGNEPSLAYLDFTPRAGADGNVPSMSLNTGLRSFESNIRSGSNPAVLTTGVEYHAACVYDAVSSLMSLYLNGVLVDSAAMTEANITQIGATEGYFGAAVNYGDPNLNGSINEVRIYNGPVSALQMAIDYAAGPDTVATNTGALLALRLVVPNTNMVILSTQAVVVYADYANVTNVNVTSAGATFTTGNSNILAVTAAGSARAGIPGTTTLIASFGGTNVSSTITVTNKPTVLAHRWNFSDGTDSVGGANATLVGTASYSGGQLVLPGGTARSNCASVNISGTLNSTVDLTVETWFTITTQQDWSKLWMFGRAAGGNEPMLSYMEFTPRAGVDGNVPSMAFNTASANEVNTRGGANPALMTNGGTYYAVATYNSTSNLMSMYVNGTLADSATMGNGNISQICPDDGFGPEAYFGAPVNYPDPCFNGSIDEMRIWKGVVPASQIAFNASAGPSTLVTNAGALTAVRLIVTNTTMARGTTQPTAVYADFANYTNLNVGTGPGVTYSSSSPGVVTVSSSGVLTAQGAGTATVTAFYGGANGSQVVTVTGGIILAHRWSFNDNTGTDSIGGANATLVGSASYSGGKLQIPGGSPRANAATVNIVNTLSSNASLTIEGWFTMNTLQGWAKVWMFGTPNGGTQPGLAYVDFTPRRGDATTAPSISLDSALATELNTSGGSNPAIMTTGVEYHAAAVYNAVSNTMYLYINGALADSASMGGANITQLQATEAWFGASVYWPDNNLNGSINELRVWNGPLTSSQIATNYALGPNALPRPTLSIVANGSNVVISWPDTFPNYTLQSTLAIGPGTWSAVSPSAGLSNGFYSVTLPATNAVSLFRLTQ